MSRGTLISNLFPKTYLLTLTAPGYRDWHENVAVEPSLVANHKYAVLIPANATDAATGTVLDFTAAGNGLATETPGGKIVMDGKTVGNGKIIAASPDMQSIVFRAPNGSYMFTDLPAGIARNISVSLSEEGLTSASSTQFFFDLSDDNLVFAADGNKIGMFDMQQDTGAILDAAQKGTVIQGNLAVSPNTVAWTRSSGKTDAPSSLVFYDLPSGTITSTTVVLGSPVKKLSWISGNILGILTENGALSLYDTNQSTLQKIADDVQEVSATREGSRIAALESNSLEIFTPNDPAGYYRFNLPDIGECPGHNLVSRRRPSLHYLCRPCRASSTLKTPSSRISRPSPEGRRRNMIPMRTRSILSIHKTA